MSQEGEDTLADKALDAGKKAASAVSSGMKKATNYATEKISAAKGSTLIKVMKYCDIILAVLLILCYPIGIITGKTHVSFTVGFMMVYCIAFSVMLIIFETGVGKFEAFIRKYFGFMYRFMGRTVFLLFTVAMVFGYKSGDSIFIMNVIVGFVGVIICLFDCFVICRHPAFQKGGEYYNADVSEASAGNGAVDVEAAPAAAAPAKKSAPAKKQTATYEANPFDSSSDDDIPSASVPGKKVAPKKAAPKKKVEVDDNPFEDDNPFDD